MSQATATVYSGFVWTNRESFEVVNLHPRPWR